MADVPRTPIAGGRAGLKYASVTSAGATFNADRPFKVVAIKFFSTADLSAATVRIEIEGQSPFNGAAVPIPMLQSPGNGNSQAPAAGAVYTWVPVEPILLDGSFGITITPSTTVGVMLEGIAL